MTTNLAKWILTADDKTKDAFASVSGNIKKTEDDIVGFAQSAAAALGVAFGMKEVIGAIVRLDSLKASLITVTGSADSAKDKFEELKKFAEETPFAMDEMVGGYIKLTARGINPTTDALRAFGNVASASGKSFDQMVEAIADAATYQFTRLEEFGINVVQQADSVELEFRGVKTKIGKNAQEITKYLTDLGNNQYAGAMTLQTETLGGAFNALRDKGLSLAEALGEAGLTSALIYASKFMVELGERVLTTKRLLGDLFEEKHSTALSNRTKVLTTDIINLTGELADLKKQAPDWYMGAETRAPRARASEVEELIKNKRDELDKVNAKLADIQGRYEAAQPKGAFVGPPAPPPPPPPKSNKALEKFIEDLKTDKTVVKDFSDRITVLNKEFNAGNLSAERYADEVTKVSGEVQKLGEQTIDIKFDSDETVLREFSDRVALINKEFNAGSISVERYAEEVARISDGVRKLGQQTVTPKFLSDDQIVKSFTAEMNLLAAEFNRGAFGAERYSSEVQKILPQIAGVVTAEKEVNAERDRAKQIIESLRTPMEDYSADIIEIDALWRANALTIDQYYALVSARSKEFADDQKAKSNEWAETWKSAFDRFAAGSGDAVSAAIFDQEKLSDGMRVAVKGVLKQVVSGLVEIGMKKLALAAIEKFALASHTATSVPIAAATAASWAPAAAAVSLATMGGNALPASAGIASTYALTEALSLAGIAHGGLDAVPQDGTYLLERGERVVKKEDNQDLAKFMRSGGSNVININTTINAKGSGAANDIRALIPLIESTSVAAVQRAMNERGRRGPYG